MNKPIVNGIDVSECCCFEDNRCLWSKRYYENNNVAPLCEAVKNCYFKQLKYLQEELDIKEKMLNKFMIGSGEILEKLQKENDELKAGFNELYNNAEQLANKYNKYGGNKENELVEIINKATDERNKYKQALEEIREIAEQWLKNDWSCYRCRSNMDEKLKEIIKLTRF